MVKRENLLKTKELLTQISLSIFFLSALAYFGQYLGLLQIFKIKLILKIAIGSSLSSGFLHLLEHNLYLKPALKVLKIKKIIKEIPAKIIFLLLFTLLAVIDLDLSKLNVSKPDILTYNATNQSKIFLAGLTILFGVLTLYKNKDKVLNPKPSKKSGLLFKLVLVFLFLFFIGIRLFFILNYKVTFSDDWQHIIAAKDFFKTGHFYQTTQSGPYNRGAYVSFLVAVFFKLFGKNVTVAKLVPVTIGTINFVLLYLISKKLKISRFFRVILLLIFISCPWTIFNHIFIRMYVFYEMFLLLTIFLSFEIVSPIKSRRYLKLFIYFLLLGIMNFVNYFWSNDFGMYTILFANSIALIYIFLTQIQKIDINKKNKLLKFIDKFLVKNIFIKSVFILLLCIILASVIDIPKKMTRFLYGETNTGKNHIDFAGLFFDFNFIFSIFFIISSMIVLFIKNNGKITILGILATSLLVMHFISSPDLQIIRGMMYFLPVFYLFAIFSIDLIQKTLYRRSKFIFIGLMLVLFSLSILNNYPSSSLKKGPYLPREKATFPTRKAYQFISENLSDYIIINVQYATKPALFFEVPVKYKLDFNNVLSREKFIHYSHYHDEKGNLRQISTDALVITHEDNFYNLVNSIPKTAIVLRDSSPAIFLNKEVVKFIDEKFPYKREFNGYKILWN